MKRKVFQSVVNYLTGSAQCIAGASLVISGSVTAGLGLIVSGIGRITSHELRNQQVNELSDAVTNSEVLKNKQ